MNEIVNFFSLLIKIVLGILCMNPIELSSIKNKKYYPAKTIFNENDIKIAFRKKILFDFSQQYLTKDQNEIIFIINNRYPKLKIKLVNSDGTFNKLNDLNTILNSTNTNNTYVNILNILMAITSIDYFLKSGHFVDMINVVDLLKKNLPETDGNLNINFLKNKSYSKNSYNLQYNKILVEIFTQNQYLKKLFHDILTDPTPKNNILKIDLLNYLLKQTFDLFLNQQGNFQIPEIEPIDFQKKDQVLYIDDQNGEEDITNIVFIENNQGSQLKTKKQINKNNFLLYNGSNQDDSLFIEESHQNNLIQESLDKLETLFLDLLKVKDESELHNKLQSIRENASNQLASKKFKDKTEDQLTPEDNQLKKTLEITRDLRYISIGNKIAIFVIPSFAMGGLGFFISESLYTLDKKEDKSLRKDDNHLKKIL